MQFRKAESYIRNVSNKYHGIRARIETSPADPRGDPRGGPRVRDIVINEYRIEAFNAATANRPCKDGANALSFEKPAGHPGGIRSFRRRFLGIAAASGHRRIQAARNRGRGSPDLPLSVLFHLLHPQRPLRRESRVGAGKRTLDDRRQIGPAGPVGRPGRIEEANRP